MLSFAEKNQNTPSCINEFNVYRDSFIRRFKFQQITWFVMLLVLAIATTILNTKTVFYIFSLAVLFILFVNGEVKRVCNTYPHYFAAAVFICAFAFVLMSEESVFESIVKYSSYVAFFILGCSLVRAGGEGTIKSILHLVLYVVLAGCAFTFFFEILRLADIYALLGRRLNGVLNPDGSVSLRYESFFGHPIVFAQSLLYALIISWYLEKHSVIRWLTIAIALILLYFTQARSGWLVLAAILLLRMPAIAKSIAHLDARYIFLIVVGLLGGLWAVCHYGLIEAIIYRFEGLLYRDASFSQRSGAIEYMVNLFLSHPQGWFFGNGFGSSSVEMGKATIVLPGFPSVDNGLVTLLYDCGLIGVISVICILIPPFSGIRNGNSRAFLCLSLCCLTTFLMLLFYDGLTYPLTSLLIWTLAGMGNELSSSSKYMLNST